MKARDLPASRVARGVKALLDEIEAALPTAVWRRSSIEKEAAAHKTIAYQGDAPGGGAVTAAAGWHFVVASFDIEPQGFPPGSRGYDGAASNGSTIVRFTPELAEQAFKIAERSPLKDKE